jgi:uncharacterized sporulation protein YeaH/YhbH (DUF444 family)
VEVADPNADISGPAQHESQSSLWLAYATLRSQKAAFQMRRVSRRDHIYPVFRQLFQRRGVSAGETPR